MQMQSMLTWSHEQLWGKFSDWKVPGKGQLLDAALLLRTNEKSYEKQGTGCLIDTQMSISFPSADRHEYKYDKDIIFNSRKLDSIILTVYA